MTDEFMLPEALKAQQWERAKGELRAFVALTGSYCRGADQTERYAEALERVEAFIAKMEGDAIAE